ncbi:MAG: antibiotic biosynthesis monooxygenase [Rhodospirillales bacterium]|jgi:heme-degrading monooxygenase HmoA|nr:antibiotic biosynthesis monooxygenase [Rhodospirillales bacterium]MBT4006942.1 antibiotic biosynthesis monooxygenase [Rhodospirillales bacterium]MBT5075188.1 antibiotic biosynthesis monooxygenase [Rhodospirillales bacterium]MBT5113031.1 antibiotic biosynthesis monooxygenase [Rhodospirillales bacterium]MBT5672907.1 antibiotic biosynthesis monooxygenase [Rhodospirillales bacterium]
MTISRVILINVPEGQEADAERVWKEDCSTLMRKQKGCTAEKLLRSLDRPGLFISYSEWDSQVDIDRYRDSEDHKSIQSESRALQGGRAVVWRYEVVE